MLLKIHKDWESRTRHLGALRGRWQPIGKNKIMKDYTEADLYRR